jgi:hypothetical protein
MTDRYENIRLALAKGPTPGPFSASRSYSSGNQELILRLTYKDEAGLPEHYCTVRSRLGGELGAEANAALIAACDPDTIRELLAERDALAAENERLRTSAVSWSLEASKYAKKLDKAREREARQAERLRLANRRGYRS